MAATPEQLAKLRAPTPKEEVKKRPGPKGVMLDYIDARYVYDLFDDSVGPQNWQDRFERDSKGHLRAGIGVLCDMGPDRDPEWVWKWDTGTPSSMEPQKGEHSDSLKRAAVHWGCGRDLYDPTPEASAPATRSASGSGGRPVAHAVSGGWTCPVHGSNKVVPAGISKRTGRSYPAFVVCGESTCDNKPPRGTKVEPVMAAPEPSEYIGMDPDDDDEEDFAGFTA